MEGFTGSEAPVRLLGLGNEILADDAVGILAAREAGRRLGEAVEVVCSSASGLHLLDDILGAKRLLVIDSMMTGRDAPGTIRVFQDWQAQPAAGGSPHSSGLFDALALARQLALAAPEEITIVGVEGADCTTVGGAMHPDVEAAVERVAALVERLLNPGPGEERP